MRVCWAKSLRPNEIPSNQKAQVRNDSFKENSWLCGVTGNFCESFSGSTESSESVSPCFGFRKIKEIGIPMAKIIIPEVIAPSRQLYCRTSHAMIGVSRNPPIPKPDEAREMANPRRLRNQLFIPAVTP